MTLRAARQASRLAAGVQRVPGGARPRPRPFQSRGRQPAWPWLPRDEAGVTDTLGAILLVGITVASAAAFGAVLFAFDGPEDTLHAEVSVRVDPGTDVNDDGNPWDDNDERVQVLHLGGESIPADELQLQVTIAGVPTTYTAAQLGVTDELGIGDVAQTPVLGLAASTAVDVVVRAQGASSVALASGVVTGSGFVPGTAGGGGGGTDPCAPDVTAPTVVLSRSDNDLTVADVLPLTVTATLSESCTSIAVAPVLRWCETSTWTHTAVTMTGGPTVYTAIITRTWALLGGHTLSFYVDGFQDVAGNTRTSATVTDTIAGLTAYTYTAVDSDSPAAAVGSLSGAVAADETCDSQAVATLTEGLVATATLYGDTATGTMTNPTRAITDNNQVATGNANGRYVEVSGFDVPATATGIRSVTIGFSAYDSSASNPTVNVDYRIGASGTNEPTTVFSSFGNGQANEADSTVTVTNERDWTIADINNLYVRVTETTASGITLSVNVVYVTVTFSVSTGTQRAASATFDWAGVPNSVTKTAQVRYAATGDTFSFQWWDATAGAYTTRAGSTAACGSFTCYSYTLTTNEYNSGAPRLRILDVAPAGTASGVLTIEYARVATT